MHNPWYIKENRLKNKLIVFNYLDLAIIYQISVMFAVSAYTCMLTVIQYSQRGFTIWCM